MLTQAQKEMRRTGVTASEASAVVRWNPYRDPMSIWLSKPTPSRGPLLDADDDEEETDRQQVGTFLEDGLRRLISTKTKIAFEPTTTLRHPNIEHILSTPDGLSKPSDDAGCEIKIVGSRMQHHWDNEAIPDYVLSQSVIGMAVTGRSRWIVGALIGGTEVRVCIIERNPELEEALVEACSAFWTDNVLGDVPPEPVSNAERRALLKARYPGSEFTKCEKVEADEVTEAMRWLGAAKAIRKALESAEADLESMLMGRVGNEYGIETSAGKFIWYPRRGVVDWKAVAAELAGGAVSTDLIEKHRGDGFRVPKFTPAKEKKRIR